MAKRDLYKAMFIANQSLVLNQIQTNYANLIISESQYLSAVDNFKFNGLQLQIMKKKNRKCKYTRYTVRGDKYFKCL